MKKNMKRRLIASVLSLVLCFAMLLGTTYAWFTDSVTSGKNKIVAGTLDIELEYKNDTQTTFATVDENTNVLKEGALWEPGHVEYAVLNVKNVGTLDLKYNLSITVASETEGTNKAGEAFKLSSYIQYAVVEGDLTGKTRSEMIAAAGEGTALNQAYASNDSLLDGENTIITLVVWMPESVGNEANYKLGTTVPEILLGVSLVATQLTSEVDSFDDQYDALAPWIGGTDDAGLAANTDATAKTVKIESADQLASFANAVNGGADYTGYTVTLETDVNLNNTPWSPINAGYWSMTFDGQDHTIYNLNVTGEKNVGFFGTFTSDTLKNLTIDGATVIGINHVAAMAGDGLCASFDKCVVKNAVITAAVKDNDDGDKVGAITGYLSAEPYASITNCSVEKSTIKGYRDVAAIVGYVNCDQATVTGNTATDVVIINDRSNNYKNYTSDAQYDVSATTVYGENASTGATYENNTLTNVTKKVSVADGVEVVEGAYLISTGAGLQYAANNLMAKGGVYKLTADIDMTGIPALSVTLPSGLGFTLDGQGHKITGVNVSGAEDQGLFATIGGHNGTLNIKNFTIEAPVVTMTSSNFGGGALIGKTGMGSGITNIEGITINGGTVNAYKYAGGLIGYEAAGGIINIKNCKVLGTAVAATNTVEGGSSSVGGFVGYSQCEIIFEGDTSTATTSAQTAKKYCGSYIGTANSSLINIKDAVNGTTAVGRTAGNTITVNGTSFTK